MVSSTVSVVFLTSFLASIILKLDTGCGFAHVLFLVGLGLHLYSVSHSCSILFQCKGNYRFFVTCSNAPVYWTSYMKSSGNDRKDMNLFSFSFFLFFLIALSYRKMTSPSVNKTNTVVRCLSQNYC